MLKIEFTYEFRFQGIAVAEIDASVEINVGRYDDDWSYGRVLFSEIGGGARVIEAIGRERGNVLAYLNRHKGIQEEIFESVRNENLGRYSYDREMAADLRAAE